MKTLGRILIILTMFTIVMGITYVAVSASSSSTSANSATFERDSENLRPFNGERPEFDGRGPEGGGWIFGLVKDIGIMSIIVALIVIPKNLMRRNTVPVRVK